MKTPDLRRVIRLVGPRTLAIDLLFLHSEFLGFILLFRMGCLRLASVAVPTCVRVEPYP